MKIVVSSWPGCGGTTLALLLSKMLNYKLYRGSETFRYLLRRLDIPDTGDGILEAENILQPYFGPIYDKYIDHLLMDVDKDNFIVESDTGAATVGKQNDLFSIFLHANDETRFAHFKTDGRAEDIETMKQRDQELRESYLKLRDFDFFDTEAISQKYNLLIDNSNINIAQELNIVLNELKKFDLGENINIDALLQKVPEEEKAYLDKGKSFILDLLKAKGQAVSVIEILKDMTSLFQPEISKFPAKLKNVMLETSNQ